MTNPTIQDEFIATIWEYLFYNDAIDRDLSLKDLKKWLLDKGYSVSDFEALDSALSSYIDDSNKYQKLAELFHDCSKNNTTVVHFFQEVDEKLPEVLSKIYEYADSTYQTQKEIKLLSGGTHHFVEGVVIGAALGGLAAYIAFKPKTGSSAKKAEAELRDDTVQSLESDSEHSFIDYNDSLIARNGEIGYQERGAFIRLEDGDLNEFNVMRQDLNDLVSKDNFFDNFFDYEDQAERLAATQIQVIDEKLIKDAYSEKFGGDNEAQLRSNFEDWWKTTNSTIDKENLWETWKSTSDGRKARQALETQYEEFKADFTDGLKNRIKDELMRDQGGIEKSMKNYASIEAQQEEEKLIRNVESSIKNTVDEDVEEVVVEAKTDTAQLERQLENKVENVFDNIIDE